MSIQTQFMFSIDTEGKYIYAITYDREGPDGVPYINTFDIHSDTLFVQNQTSYFILNKSGRILKKYQKKQ